MSSYVGDGRSRLKRANCIQLQTLEIPALVSRYRHARLAFRSSSRCTISPVDRPLSLLRRVSQTLQQMHIRHLLATNRVKLERKLCFGWTADLCLTIRGCVNSPRKWGEQANKQAEGLISRCCVESLNPGKEHCFYSFRTAFPSRQQGLRRHCLLHGLPGTLAQPDVMPCLAGLGTPPGCAQVRKIGMRLAGMFGLPQDWPGGRPLYDILHQYCGQTP